MLFATAAGNARQADFPKLHEPHSEQTKPGISSPSQENAVRESLLCRYIANMGVLIRSRDHKILIDALFTNSHPNCRNPENETIERIIKGEAPFDGVDLMLVTHKDQDHFNAALTVRYLETCPEPILIAPSDAVKEMRKTAKDWSKMEHRVISIDLQIGEKAEREAAHIPVTIIRTTHGTTSWPMNLMFLFEVNGWRVFHEGDASGRPDDYRGLGLETTPIDLAIVQYSWPIHPHLPFRGFLLDFLKPDHIALAHVNVKEENVAESKIDPVRRKYKDIFVLLPGMPVKTFRK